MDAIHIGSIALPLAPLILLGTFLIGSGVGKLAGRARQIDIEQPLWNVLLIGVLVARLAFVTRYFDLYLNAPWTILDIRDGGFHAVAGLIATITAGAWYAWRQPIKRKAMAVSMAAGIAFWSTATLVGSLMAGATQLPQTALASLDGRTVKLKDFLGKPMVINLWATWCPPCRREMPVLQDAQLRHPDVHFVFVNQGEAAEVVRQYLQSNGLDLKNALLDPQLNVGKETGARAMPTTLFFDAQGKLIDRRLGEVSKPSLEQRIETLRLTR